MKPACGVCRLSALTATNDETSIVRCFTINGYLDTNTFVPSCRHGIENKAGKQDVGQQKPGGFSGWPTCSIEAFSQLNPRGWRWQTRSDNVDVLRNRLLPEIPSTRAHTHRLGISQGQIRGNAAGGALYMTQLALQTLPEGCTSPQSTRWQPKKAMAANISVKCLVNK